jgi:hypothetical protein
MTTDKHAIKHRMPSTSPSWLVASSRAQMSFVSADRVARPLPIVILPQSLATRNVCEPVETTRRNPAQSGRGGGGEKRYEYIRFYVSMDQVHTTISIRPCVHISGAGMTGAGMKRNMLDSALPILRASASEHLHQGGAGSPLTPTS